MSFKNNRKGVFRTLVFFPTEKAQRISTPDKTG
jgi:hypothetical protein